MKVFELLEELGQSKLIADFVDKKKDGSEINRVFLSDNRGNTIAMCHKDVALDLNAKHGVGTDAWKDAILDCRVFWFSTKDGKELCMFTNKSRSSNHFEFDL